MEGKEVTRHLHLLAFGELSYIFLLSNKYTKKVNFFGYEISTAFQM
jgi:hypothetical protein